MIRFARAANGSGIRFAFGSSTERRRGKRSSSFWPRETVRLGDEEVPDRPRNVSLRSRQMRSVRSILIPVRRLARVSHKERSNLRRRGVQCHPFRRAPHPLHGGGRRRTMIFSLRELWNIRCTRAYYARMINRRARPPGISIRFPVSLAFCHSPPPPHASALNSSEARGRLNKSSSIASDFERYRKCHDS